MTYMKGLFIIIVGMCFVTMNASAQLSQYLKREDIVKLVAGSVYMIEKPTGNICLSIGKDGILVVKNPKVILTDEDQAAIKSFKDVPLQLIDESTQSPLKFNDEEVRVMNFSKKGFNQFSIVFFSQSRVIYMGNHLFAGMFPKIDLGRGTDVEKYTDTISVTLEDLSDESKIIPGYGRLSSKEDLENFKRMLIETTAVVRTKIKLRKSKSTILTEGLGEQWSIWGNGLVSTEEWLGTIYESLMRK